jgi:hypothetical protein
MIHEVKFQGLSHSPSDYDAQDGELGICLNLINEDGSLKPIQSAYQVESFTLPEGASIEYVHKVTHDSEIHSHYIIKKADGSWWWTEKGGDGALSNIDLGEFNVNAVSAVGNILCLVGESETRYAYWNVSTYNYNVLCHSDFDFRTTITRLSNTTGYGNNASVPYNISKKIDFDTIWQFLHTTTFGGSSSVHVGGKDIVGIRKEGANLLFSTLDAYYNEAISGYTPDPQPYTVFGVVAIRLFDGSYFNISNLFVLGTGLYTYGEVKISLYQDYNYAILANKVVDSRYVSSSLLFLSNYQICIKFPQLEKIYDLIQGVEIFLSKGISFVSENSTYSQSDLSIQYNEGSTFCNFTPKLMTKDEAYDAIDQLVFTKSVFIGKERFGEKVSLNRITGTETSISLANLYRNNMGAMCCISYNNRLQIANITQQAPTLIDSFDKSTDVKTQYYSYDVIVKARSVLYTVWWRGDYAKLFSGTLFCLPVTDVTSVEIYRYNKSDSDLEYHSACFTPHSSETMGYSFYLGETDDGKLSFELPWNTSTEEQWNTIVKEYENAAKSPSVEHYYSLLRVSEVENPLVFPVNNSVQVGNSIISALSSNTRPISEGQFGEAPLYAFTDEGVWVLMTSSTGTYESRQPANRMICSNPKGILQIDDAVLFPTESGIMMQSGRECSCITEQLDDYPFDFTQLYKNEYAKKVLGIQNFQESEVKYTKFRDFLKSADMIYDYYDSRIIVFNPDYSYAYVYSLKSQLWSTMQNVFKKRINIYPESYAISNDNTILDVYNSGSKADVPYMLCSRPLALSSNEVYKTIFSCITRGYFRNEDGKCGMVLYGSNDLFHWFPIKTSATKYLRGMAGSPYKYFRIALTGKLHYDESISGISADFQERWQNKLR